MCTISKGIGTSEESKSTKQGLHTLNSAYKEVACNENLAITKENLLTKYTNSPINTLALTKSRQ